MGTAFPTASGTAWSASPRRSSTRARRPTAGWGTRAACLRIATLADVDLDLATGLFRRTVFQGRSVEELLERYGLVVPRAGGAGITNACLLLFGRAPLVRWHPRAAIRFFRVAGIERRDGAARNVTRLPRLDVPLAAAIPEAHRLAREQIRHSEKLHDLFAREMPAYPEFAWQEALVNACAHRDHEDQTRETEV